VTDTPLGEHLRRLIVGHGPISVARFMTEALGNPELGYYMTRDPFGAAGDFVTAPEISQMFGELIGAWCADLWQQMGEPKPLRLVEIGPGRGTLLNDALRATRRVPGFHDSLDLHLVETSPLLRDRQAATLAGYAINWHTSVAALPEGRAIVVANELFDALPVHQFQFTDGTWHERLIDIASNGAGLRFVLDPAPAEFPDLETFENPAADAIAEVSPAATAFAQHLASRIDRWGGAVLIIDYGHDRPGFGDTVQGVRAHRFQDILSAPGMVDICAHVDFAALGRVGRSGRATVWGPVPQGAFLRQLGLDARAEALATASPTDRAAIAAAAHRLTDPGQMGTLFKVLAFASAGLSPAGFATP